MNAKEIQNYIDARGRLNSSIKKKTNLSNEELYCVLKGLDYDYYKNFIFLSFNRGFYLNFKKGIIINDYNDILKYKNIILTKNNKLETNKMKNIKFTSKEIYDILYGCGICIDCFSETDYITFTKGYKLRCKKCSRRRGGIISREKSIKTNIEKYGCEHPMQNKDIAKKKVTNTDYSTLNDKVKATCIEKYGDIFQRTEVFKNKRETTCIEKYGVENPLLIVAELNFKTLKWTPYDMLSDKEMYYRQVSKYQQKFSKEIKNLENFEQRGKKSQDYHIDHMYSKHQGFHNGVLPYYIGHICNLEMIQASLNTSKREQCSIILDKLYNKIAEYDIAVLTSNC